MGVLGRVTRFEICFNGEERNGFVTFLVGKKVGLYRWPKNPIIMQSFYVPRRLQATFR